MRHTAVYLGGSIYGPPSGFHQKAVLKDIEFFCTSDASTRLFETIYTCMCRVIRWASIDMRFVIIKQREVCVFLRLKKWGYVAVGLRWLFAQNSSKQNLKNAVFDGV